jgi:phosphoribosylanthranilate isomerase
VKVCGVTSVDDAVMAVDLGAELVGLNFYPQSPRFITVDVAARISAAVRRRRADVELVGVFVRALPAELERIDGALGLDLLQFHGDEDPETLSPFGARAIKVWRWQGRPSEKELARYASAWGFLLDRRSPQYGGTGEAWNYAEAADLPTGKPVLLAGGVGPGNARAAVAAARPWGIDVCSRVERAPGVKDRALLTALFREIRDGEAQPA